MGLLDSLYLTWLKIANNKALCIPGLGDCWSVNTSRYSEIFGIPVAVLGALAYVTILVLLAAEPRIPFFQHKNSYLLFGLTLTGVLYSAYLTYLEFFVIRAICPFCVVSALILVALFTISAHRLLHSQ